jgi:hypothetical protein
VARLIGRQGLQDFKPPHPGRLGILADAMDSTRSSAFAYVHPVCITCEVVKVR